MSFYENTLIAKQDLPASELKKIKEKYNDLINSNSGKVVKIEEWGLLNLATKIKKYNKELIIGVYSFFFIYFFFFNVQFIYSSNIDFSLICGRE